MDPESFESLILIDARTDWLLQREKFKSLRDLRIQNFWSQWKTFSKSIWVTHEAIGWPPHSRQNQSSYEQSQVGRLGSPLVGTILNTSNILNHLWQDTFVYSILTDLLSLIGLLSFTLNHMSLVEEELFRERDEHALTHFDRITQAS
jgi:hypothetical protein